ncbi:MULTISPECIES: MgtC/SapB family protein [Breznakia]|uniref:Putative Mg2+ transporter-C (MgtC) family protein n=1 Tax=Breznakia blatticola TaxID=1754012 RepID=A0A4V3G648_9FIRM|nr:MULTISPECIES: MgtC/SapB family protein [Breznakia]MDH6368098.1 putative Mg2+ transporter-C (MgtC) family protein [Breznakia sp. PH1-1]MDH6405187.1 putative Mg2+ transporter-C (MgtC) family protein [Breznakia sp. PF1-11]MDH6412909.1 putative Mg2+ transporter-C (MgtC) family protein [Breznakia sp. PFB1-11]MDH6415271.1 putative Mg2+ transporter-C (MgtC) family protein [Breznakia sp. PFB1-14]MDH6417580.1 putative Mg2+ transporter-C (MgtC) family protein [Breznakia sp. PFB1-4]
MSVLDITIRLTLATIISGLIGFDREYKNRPAGIRTHILVCVGATIIALIQTQVHIESIALASENLDLLSVVSSDRTRLVAQVVSGIGFLGAGTIIVNKKSVSGLTTAASLWASACLGIAIGMGYYAITFVGSVAIIGVLSILHRFLKVPTQKKLEIQYIHRIETKSVINDYFESRDITVADVDFRVEKHDDYRVYCNFYTINLPKGLYYADIIEDLSLHKNVTKIRMVNA